MLNRTTFRCQLLVLTGLLLGSSQPLGSEPTVRDVLGKRVPDFVLSDTSGEQVALSDFNDGNAVVVVFLGTSCPIGNAYVPVLNDLQNRYEGHGVRVLGINANLADVLPQ